MNRRRKIILIIFLLAFLVVFLNFSDIMAFVGNRVMWIELVDSMDKSDKASTEELLNEKVKALSYNGHPVVYDKETNIIYITQNLTNGVWEGKLSTTTGRLAFKEDEAWENKVEAIAEGHIFELYLVEDEGYYSFNVIFSGMPIMVLEQQEGLSQEAWNGKVEVYDPYRTTNDYQLSECSYNIRGGTSREFPKKGYKVELLDGSKSYLGMRKDDDWILNALYDDAGLIHNKLSMEVWKKITDYNTVNGDSGFREEYIELFINGRYQGVYLLSERVDEKELSLKNEDILYKCRATRIPEEHNYTNEITDDMRPIFILKYPQTYVEEDWQPLKDWVDRFLKGKAESYDEAVGLINLENAIDYNLFCLLIGGSDNQRKNVFFTAEYQKDGTYQFIKNPWDLNATWGNPWVGLAESNNTLYDPEYYLNVSTWATDISTLYFLDEEKVSQMLYEYWVDLRENGVINRESIVDILDTQFEYLYASGAYNRNYERWPNGTEYWQDNYIYEYVEKRIDFLDEYFQKLYMGNITAALYDGIDYSDEFEARFYWETYYDILSELYSYDRDVLLEHYVLYGKPYGHIGRRTDNSQIPVS
ncbi:MAG: CotH kinase family protein [Lachnospiraceae bacterium]